MMRNVSLAESVLFWEDFYWVKWLKRKGLTLPSAQQHNYNNIHQHTLHFFLWHRHTLLKRRQASSYPDFYIPLIQFCYRVLYLVQKDGTSERRWSQTGHPRMLRNRVPPTFLPELHVLAEHSVPEEPSLTAR